MTLTSQEQECFVCGGGGRLSGLEHCPVCRKPENRRLKVWPQFYAPILDGTKTFEIRDSSDRGFSVGQIWLLEEFCPARNAYTGRSVLVKITYLCAAFLPKDKVVWAFKILDRYDRQFVNWLDRGTIGEGLRVAYIPTHANGDITHKDVEFGLVTSFNETGAFVRYDSGGQTSKQTFYDNLVGKQGEMWVQHEYADPECAPVVVVCDTQTEATRQEQLGVWYRYELFNLRANQELKPANRSGPITLRTED